MYEAKVDRDTVVVAGHGVVAGKRLDQTLPALTAGEVLPQNRAAITAEEKPPLQ